MPFFRRKKERDNDPFFKMFGNIFNEDFLEEFDKIREQMEEQIERSIKENEDIMRRGKEINPGQGSPMIYGFSININPHGKVRMEEFGNVKPDEKKVESEREPLIDVMDKGKTITVLAELPGVSEKQIKVSIKGKNLTISVPKKFKKNLKLESNAKLVKKHYKNGVLELDLKKK
jgi:HSP20 family protein